MNVKENTVDAVLSQKDTTGAKRPVQDDLWENCKGQCGFTPWCRECTLVREKLLEEKLNRKGRPDDKEE
jgi:hypothetical protein